MSRKQLLTYQFGKCILSEIELFHYTFAEVGYAYHKEHKPDLLSLKFDWEWNGYSGSGHIHFLKGTANVVNITGENFSQMDVSSNSKKKPSTGKMYSPIYNDSSLEPLFNMLLGEAKKQGII